ncbi:hypothetical protein RD110_20215 [Rhodoferax koreense]|uniref:Amidohydrolase-related domain-containing protein n=1 Tax=Rhodoferax koreensis TaxID=1842727 RepID=A0A1P8JZS1_9BURK|nr:amidohydrolase family protein [Rhodoferax koreense]APW39250.1 hypothetical protein RD110_20215 [Rhodoferax koreense]
MRNESRKWVTHQAWVEGKWERDVVLAIGADGTWASVLPNASAAQQAGATRLDGPVLPGVVNAHSHVLQRMRAGLTERRGVASQVAQERRTHAAQRVTPAQLEAVAGQLYAELLLGGYTHVCEFLFLHAEAAAEPLQMAQALARAARGVGIGLTLLPALASAGHSGPAPVAELLAVVEAINRQTAAAVRVPAVSREASSAGAVLVGAGVGLGGLDTADRSAMQALTAAARKTGLPVHIHIAEQPSAVDDCLARTGQRPIEWLLAHADVDARWNLVHATHASPAEIGAVRSAGAAIVVCPSSAANLGRGVFDLPAFAAVGGNWSIGSDRHVARSWPEELRLLEYTYRLQRHARNVAAEAAGRESCAAVLFDAVVAGGQAATGQRVGPIQVGRRADFLVLDAASNALLGLPADHHLDALLFSSPSARFRDVFVAGARVVREGRLVGPQNDTALAVRIGEAFVPVMQAQHVRPAQAVAVPRPA